MKKLIVLVSCAFIIVFMSLTTFATANVVGEVGMYYPLLGEYTPPEGSSILLGEVIGAEFGWDDNPYTNALRAFDGDHGNIYDQRVTADYENEYAGILVEEAHILTAARILPVTDVDWQANRMNGMAIQGSNDCDTWVTLWQSDKPATIGSNDFITVTTFENNDGYIMFRACNITGDHTAYRELQFFGYPEATGSIDSSDTPGYMDLTEVMQSLEYTDLSVSDSPLKYRLYVPESYEAEKSYYVLLHLHGAGEISDDNIKPITDVGQTALIRRILEDEVLREKFIIVVPQCPPGSRWVEKDWGAGTYVLDQTPQSVPSLQVMSLLQKEITVKYNVDSDRIYVTGLSMGAFGTWDLICRYPDYFAAAIPVCGGADISYAETIKHIPIWTFHSEDDTIVSPEGTKGMVSALTALGADITFTQTDPWGHGAWGVAYTEETILDWLTSKSRTATEESESEAISPEEDETTDTEPDASESTSDSSHTENTQTSTSDEPSSSSRETDKSNIWLWIIGGAAIVVIALIVAITVRKKKSN